MGLENETSPGYRVFADHSLFITIPINSIRGRKFENHSSFEIIKVMPLVSENVIDLLFVYIQNMLLLTKNDVILTLCVSGILHFGRA